MVNQKTIFDDLQFTKLTGADISINILSKRVVTMHSDGSQMLTVTELLDGGHSTQWSCSHYLSSALQLAI